MLKDIVERYIKFYNAFQISEMVELFTDDCIFQNVSNSSGIITTVGKDELQKLAKQNLALFSKKEQIVTNWVIGENKIAVEIDFTAELACDFPNGMKKGDTLQLKGVSIYEFKSDKIKRLVDFS